MAKPGIKVRELAKELGVTSRSIVNRCRDEGLPVQNGLTRLNPAIEAAVRAWFKDAPA
jgi:hypothetical protein